MHCRLTSLLLLITLAAHLGSARGSEPDFDRGILPILKSKCFGCHGPNRQEGGLRIDFRDRALAGGDSGPAFVPGDSGASELIRRVTSRDEDERMPPDGKRLSDQQVESLRRWIDSDAPGLPAFDPKAAWRRHWSFQPVTRPAPPKIEADTAAVGNAIDAFVLAKLTEHDLPPSGPAPRETLIRRLSLDLTGLLPKVDRVRRFIEDDRPDAWERLVDEYLASPHYGERWGRHWLDLARYADSSGYESDQPRMIWAYRDWVINSLNDDKPFDRFVVEQIAGDLLPQASRDELIATGFHCNAIFDGGVRWQAVVDRVNTTGAVFLGLTTECARCHSHKTDPLTQREFYQLYAFFNEASATPFSIAGDNSKDETLTTLVMKATPQPTHVFRRGDPGQPGLKVTSNVPAFLVPLKAAPGRPSTRLDLARWLVSRDNPLTARVTVNRIWQRFFGRGLVETEDDFGLQTPKPGHAELLDWLASEFVDGGWSLKKLQRTILLSATYRQSSVLRSDLRKLDPENGLLARQRRLRLPAENIRDVMLDAAGLLSTKIGGPSVFPWQPEGILQNRATPATWKQSEGSDAYRRGLYTWVWRLTPHPHLPLFDAPDGIASCTKRSRSNVPVQALTLLNDPTFVEAAQGLARRVVLHRDDVATENDSGRLTRLFEIALSRRPHSRESELMLPFIRNQRNSFRAKPDRVSLVAGAPDGEEGELIELATWTVVARSIMNIDEFYTRE